MYTPTFSRVFASVILLVVSPPNTFHPPTQAGWAGWLAGWLASTFDSSLLLLIHPFTHLIHLIIFIFYLFISISVAHSLIAVSYPPSTLPGTPTPTPIHSADALSHLAASASLPNWYRAVPLPVAQTHPTTLDSTRH